MRASTIILVFLAMLASACSSRTQPTASAPPPTAAPAAAKPASLPPPPVIPPPAPSAFAGEALSHLLTCGNPDFLVQPSEKQSESLQTEPRLHCQPATGSHPLSCVPAEPVSAFGLRLVGVTFNHDQGGHGLRAQLQGDMPALLAGIAEAYPKPTSSALQGKLISLSPDDSVALRARESAESGQVDFECRIAAPGELLFVTLNEPMTPSSSLLSTSPTSTPTTPEAAPTTKPIPPTAKPRARNIEPGTSAIGGHIEFPGESIPALHVCAFSDDGSWACVRTEREQSRYRIEDLPSGNYQVWAWLIAPEGDMRVMRAVHDVQCIAAPCPPQPRTVAVPDATKVDGVTVNEAAANYPDQPAEPPRQ